MTNNKILYEIQTSKILRLGAAQAEVTYIDHNNNFFIRSDVAHTKDLQDLIDLLTIIRDTNE